MSESRYDSILFDFDGVLADTEPLHFACWSDVVRPLGIALDWEAYQRHAVGLTDLEFLRFLSPADPERLRQFYPEKRRLFRERCLRQPPIPPAIVSLVSSLFHYRLAVVSSSNKAEVEPVLAAAGIRDRFAALVCGRDVPRPKPAPDPYLLAADRLAARSPLVVEDSDAGVASARAAGFDVVRVASVAEVPGRLRAALGA